MNENSFRAGDLENNFSHLPGERDNDAPGRPGLEGGGHSLPNVEDILFNNSSRTNFDYDEEGHRYPSKKKIGVFFISLILALVVIGASVGIAVSVQNKNQSGDTSSVAAQQQSPKEDVGEKDTGLDIDDRPPESDEPPQGIDDTDTPAASYTTTAPAEMPVAVPTERNAMSFLTACGINPEKMSDEDSPHFQALRWIEEEDGLALEVPVGKDTPEGYEFLTRYVLALMYYTMDGSRWLFGMNFLTAQTFCAWHMILTNQSGQQLKMGVECNADTNQVEALYFMHNRLAGSLLPELGLLTTLTEIKFDINKIRGTIPTEWQTLTNMETLRLQDNELTGTIPEWMEKYSSIEVIIFSSNNMEGVLPTFLGQMTALKILALDRNLFSGASVFDSSSTTGLRDLQALFLENNLFNGTLDENFLGEMTSLRYLDISDNQFSGQIPSHFFEMPELEVLDLHDNDLSQLPQTFAENNKLEFLALQKCDFKNQPIPSSISNLRNLTHLDLSQNSFTGDIPASLGALTHLTYLFLAENDFVPGPIPAWLGELEALEEISLKTTRRNGSIPDFFVNGGLSRLVMLDLDNNEITGTIPASIGSLPELRILLLNRNNLNSAIPESFKSSKNLRLIFLESNEQITGDLGELFCENPVFSRFKPIIIANCDICDPHLYCCAQCCVQGLDCNIAVEVPDMDPIWQHGYEREVYAFINEDAFPQELYQDDP